MSEDLKQLNIELLTNTSLLQREHAKQNQVLRMILRKSRTAKVVDSPEFAARLVETSPGTDSSSRLTSEQPVTTPEVLSSGEQDQSSDREIPMEERNDNLPTDSTIFTSDSTTSLQAEFVITNNELTLRPVRKRKKRMPPHGVTPLGSRPPTPDPRQPIIVDRNDGVVREEYRQPRRRPSCPNFRKDV